MSLVKIYCVLFALFSLTFSAAATPFNNGDLRSITGGRNISGPLGSLFTVEPLWLPTFAELPLPQSPSKLKETSRELEAEFKETLLLLWQITLRDSKLLYSKAQRNLENSCASGLATAKVWLKGVLNGLLWAVIFIWSSLIWAMCCWIFYLVTTFTMPVVCIVLLYAFTTFMVKALAWTLSGWPTYLAKCIYKAGKIIFTVPKFRRNYVEEKEVKGFTSIKIPQQPPRACVLEIQYDDASHAGYASCVRLYDGTLGLMTAQHVCDAALNGKVASTKTPNKIPLSQFTPLIISEKGDFALLSGPPNWESLLGCKGAMFVPASQLAKSKMRFHFIEKNEWMADHGEVVGPRDSWFAATLCNSQPGHSGTPIFNGKMILGVHVGADKDENHNLMATIPPVPGITSPQYVFETTAPQGRVFNDEDIDEMLKSISKSIPRLQDFKSITGKNWADYDEEKKAAEKKIQQEAAKPSILQEPGKRGRQSCLPKQQQNGEGIEQESSARGQGQRKRGRPRQVHPKQASRISRRRRRNVRENAEQTGGEDRPLHHREEGGGSSGCQSHEETQGVPAAQETAESFQRYFGSQYKWEVSTPTQEIPGFQKCGTLPCYYRPKQIKGSEWGAQLIQEHPELGEKVSGFGWPLVGPQAEVTSLTLQAERWLQRAQSAKIPSDEDRERVIQKTVEAYANVKTYGPTATRGDKLEWRQFIEDFKSAVFSLELDAGIGVPYIAYGRPTHKGWVEDPKLLPVLARLTFNRLQKMLKVESSEMSAEELVQAGLCDPIRVFVKREPHKQSKLDEGRYRLIMSVSLVDQLVARVLFQNQNKREIALWRVNPSKPGFGLSTDEQVLEFVQALAAQVEVPVEEVITSWQKYLVPTDCSGFDWSVAEWMLHDDMIVRNKLTLDLNPTTEKLRFAWLKCISNSVLCLSDGTLLAQRVPGVQKSGSYNTSSSNSRIRVMAAYHCGADWAMAMGDDALESVNTNLEVYKSLGFKVEVSGQLEFCSHIFRAPDLALPVNERKMLYKLIFGYNPGSGSLEVISNYIAACASVLNELRHDPDSVALLYQWLVNPVLPQND
uniref:RNA-dependent RNA polymerase n=1 Tax=Pepper vein yellows virus 10 TaxID=3073889 RepID=A0AA51UD98_9VIRU|nr:RNA-dependent RNA polymerase [Pepper vein yellows virus 10]